MAKKRSSVGIKEPETVAAPAGPDNWQTEQDARTLMQAQEIHAHPKRGPAARQHLLKTAKAARAAHAAAKQAAADAKEDKADKGADEALETT